MKKTLLALAVSTTLSTPLTTFAKTNFSGEYRQGEILSFGSSLNKSEEAALRDYFGVSSDMEAIYVDNATAIEQLGLAPNALDNYTGGWYSSAFVKLTDKGGVNVTSKNVSLVTDEMFANALITSGILNCEVNVSAPFVVTGESALAGILAGAEKIMGGSLSEENKVVAKEEIDTTLEIADEILNNSNNEINNTGDSSTIASGIINDIKQQVIKDSPNSTQIQQIIINVTNNYGVELSEETNARVLRLMEDVNDLDIEYKDIKDTMQNIGNSISESLKEAGVKLQESGILEKIGNWFIELFGHIGNWFKELFTSSTATNELQSQDVESMEETISPIEIEEVVEQQVIEAYEENDEHINGGESNIVDSISDLSESVSNSLDTSVSDDESLVKEEITPEDEVSEMEESTPSYEGSEE